MDVIKISVVIPAYNGGKYIAECIQSVLNQTRKSDQIAVIIDESHDNTEEICKSFGNQIEIYHNAPATGFVDAWNRAIGKAKYDWICLLHQDDTIEPDFLKEATEVIAKYPDIKFIYGLCDYMDENGIHWNQKRKDYRGDSTSMEPYIRQTGYEYNMTYFHGNANRCPGVIAHRDVFQAFLFRNEPGLVADNDFFWRVGSKFDAVRINHKVASFRHHPDSATHMFKNLDYSMFTEYCWMYDDFRQSGTFAEQPDLIHGIADWIAKYGALCFVYELKFHREYWFTNARKYLAEIKHFQKTHPHFLTENNITSRYSIYWKKYPKFILFLIALIQIVIVYVKNICCNLIFF